MVIRVYWASVTSNRKIDGDQVRLRNMIESLKLESQWIDITTARAVMTEMREKCQNPKALPPQIFNGDVYLGNVDDLDRSIEEHRVMEWLKMDPSSQQTAVSMSNDVNTNAASISTVCEPHDVVDAAPTNGISSGEKKATDTEISPVAAHLSGSVISNFSAKKMNQNVDEDRRRRILGLPPLEYSGEQTATTPATNDLVESSKVQDVSKLKSLYEAKDAA